jgi:NAD(P)H dehydrogenase (quinone)
MILVTGATGEFGSKAIDHLLKKGVRPYEILALVRDAGKAQNFKDKGIEVRVGDYTDPDNLVKVFQGVDKLLLVSSNDKQAIENRTAQHLNVITAAKAAQVKHVIYTSFVRKADFEHSAIAAFQHSHVQTETALKGSGMQYTILRNGIYLEMIPIFTGEKVAETGVLLFPAAAGTASFVLREELAEAAAHVLSTGGHENKLYELTNTQVVSFFDIANAVSNAFGKAVTYQSPSVDEFESILKSFGVPDLYVGMFTMWASAIKEGALDVVDDTLERFLGRQPKTMLQFINQVYS